MTGRIDVHRSCRRALQLASDGASARRRLDVAAARRDERHSIAQQLRGLGEGFKADAEFLAKKHHRDTTAADVIAAQLGWVADQIDPDQAVRSVPGAAGDA